MVFYVIIHLGENMNLNQGKSKKVEILLYKSLRGYGVPGDKVLVAPGFARNRLIPAGYADYATAANLKKLEAQKVELSKLDAENVAAAKVMKEKINGVKLNFFCKVRENTNIYGSIQSRDIVIALKEQGFDIAKSQIVLSHPLKVLGEYDVK